MPFGVGKETARTQHVVNLASSANIVDGVTLSEPVVFMLAVARPLIVTLALVSSG